MMRRLTTDEWIAKAKAKHGDRYDYSEVAYVNGTTKVKIHCPEHGIFLQTPHTHTRPSGGGKCPDCMKDAGRSTARITTEEWIAKVKTKHGERYNYSEVVYVNQSTKVRIGCPEHGIFLQNPKSHLLGRGPNCPKCSRSRAFTTEEWLVKARETHGGHTLGRLRLAGLGMDELHHSARAEHSVEVEVGREAGPELERLVVEGDALVH